MKKINEEASIDCWRVKNYISNFEYHYTRKARVIWMLVERHHLSERQIAKHVGMSKSEVNRMLSIGMLDQEIRFSAERYKTDKYVLLHFWKTKHPEIEKGILSGKYTKYRQVKGLV